MFEYLLYMLVPTLLSASLLYVFGIRPRRLEGKLARMAPFVIGLSFIMYLLGEAGTCTMKPWLFDCGKTLGFCPCGLPVEDALFAVLVVLNITMGALAFREIELLDENKGKPGRRVDSLKEFIE